MQVVLELWRLRKELGMLEEVLEVPVVRLDCSLQVEQVQVQEELRRPERPESRE